MAEFVTELYHQFFEFPDLHNQFYTELYVTGLVISLLCALIGSAQGAYAALRLRPAEAMRPKPPKQGRHIWLERFAVVLAAAVVRLADGAAQRDPQPRCARASACSPPRWARRC